jgi:hypothetical protein
MAETVPGTLDDLKGEERNKVYRMLGLEVTPTAEGYSVTGALRARLQNGTAALGGNRLRQECDGTGWVLSRSETVDGGFGETYRPCTRGHAPRYCMGYCNDRLCARPPVPRWCAAGEATTARITSRIHDGRDVENAREAVWRPGA